jgi:uncharacterized ferredoxin-like protein
MIHVGKSGWKSATGSGAAKVECPTCGAESTVTVSAKGESSLNCQAPRCNFNSDITLSGWAAKSEEKASK